MARFTELGEYKNTILSELVTNKNIVKALGNSESNFLDISPIDNPMSLIWNKIFPYSYVPEAQAEQKSYITVLFHGFRLVNGEFKAGYITFYVFCHHSLMRTSYSSLRTDMIVNYIDEIFNKTTNLGIGKLQFEKMDDIKIDSNHFGCAVTYKDYSFN